MVKILAAATAWHLVTCVCALLACSARAIATAKSTTHCQHMPALCALCKSHNSNRCAPRQRAVSMCCMHRRNGCRSTRCDLETGLGRRYGALAHHLRAHWRLPAMILRMIDRVVVEQLSSGVPKAQHAHVHGQGHMHPCQLPQPACSRRQAWGVSRDCELRAGI